MGIENPVHLLFIAIVALIVLGPKRLPELARALGHGIREFRESVSQGGPPGAAQPDAAQPPVAAQSVAAEAVAVQPVAAEAVVAEAPAQQQPPAPEPLATAPPAPPTAE